MKDLEFKLELLDQLQSGCNRCGLCLESCATFQSSGWEHESPRGRLQLAEQFLHGSISPDSHALSTFDHCLGCSACEYSCPQKVPYGQVRQLVQTIRRDLRLVKNAPMAESLYRRWITAVSRISSIKWRLYGARWITIPRLPHRCQGSFSSTMPRPPAGKPILVTCCIQDLYMHEEIRQALLILEKLGEKLYVDHHQPCCGAIFERLVDGAEETLCYPAKQKKAAALQKKRRQAFRDWLPEQAYFLSRGCQIGCFEGKTKDVYAWIEALLEERGIVLQYPVPEIVYYQPYCRSKKGEEDSIWRLLKRVKGLSVREIAHPHACCGGFCGEMLFHPERARLIVEEKVKDLPLGAVIVTSSPDCWGQFASCAEERQLQITSPIQLIWKCLSN